MTQEQWQKERLKEEKTKQALYWGFMIFKFLFFLTSAVLSFWYLAIIILHHKGGL